MLVSVIIPSRNEAAHLGACLDSVLHGTWPRERLEVLVVDGASEDGSREIAGRYAREHDLVQVLDNPARSAPAALNIGLSRARGEIVVRMDAHVRYPPDYLERLVMRLESTGADNVGGCVATVPAAETVVAHAIARALSHPFGVGDSWFRIGGTTPRWVDTVPFGCYRRETLMRLGGFDEDLIRNQDDELNARLRRRGGRILLDPNIVVEYVGRATYRQLARMYFQYGLFKPLAAWRAGGAITLRQLVPPFAVAMGAALAVAALVSFPALATLAVLGVTYVAVAMVAAAQALRTDGVRAGLALVFAFFTLHVAYGWGYLRGLVRFWGRAGSPRVGASLPLSR